MKKSEQVDKIAPAFLQAQKAIGNVVKGQKNLFFKSNYAGLPDVMEGCKEALNEVGISVLQTNGKDEFGPYVETTLIHSSGQWFESKLYLILNKQDMQGLGSSVTYARRYDLQGIVFMGAEDDDGESAVGRSKSSLKQNAVLLPKEHFVSESKKATPEVLPKEVVEKRAGGFKTTAAPANETTEW